MVKIVEVFFCTVLLVTVISRIMNAGPQHVLVLIIHTVCVRNGT